MPNTGQSSLLASDKINQDPSYRMMFPSLQETNMLRCNFSCDFREALLLILCLLSFITVLLLLPSLFIGTFPELEGKGQRVKKPL